MLIFNLVLALSACGRNGNTAKNYKEKGDSSSQAVSDAQNEQEDVENSGTPADTEKPSADETKHSEATIDYGTSEMFTSEDMDIAISMINDKFAKWRDCDVHSIRYGGDDKNIEDNVAWANDCIEGQNFTEVMEFETDFHSPTEASGEWGDSDTEYDDYQWWFARSPGGKWQLFYWSY